jgi:hypothetical protein
MLLKAALLSPHSAFRITKGASHLTLRSPSLIDQVYHRIRFGDLILERILSNDQTGDNDNGMIAFGPKQATVVDDLKVRWVSEIRKQFGTLLDAHAPKVTILKKSGQFWVRTPAAR